MTKTTSTILALCTPGSFDAFVKQMAGELERDRALLPPQALPPAPPFRPAQQYRTAAPAKSSPPIDAERPVFLQSRTLRMDRIAASCLHLFMEQLGIESFQKLQRGLSALKDTSCGKANLGVLTAQMWKEWARSLWETMPEEQKDRGCYPHTPKSSLRHTFLWNIKWSMTYSVFVWSGRYCHTFFAGGCA